MSSWDRESMMQTEKEDDYSGTEGTDGTTEDQECSKQTVWSVPVMLPARGTKKAEDRRLPVVTLLAAPVSLPAGCYSNLCPEL